MPKYTDYPAASSLDGTEVLAVTVNPSGSALTKKATTAQIAALSGVTIEATLNGSVGGHAKVVQIASSVDYKCYRVILDAFNDAGQNYTWGTAFSDFTSFLQNSTPPATTSTTVLALPATGGAINSVIEVCGK